LLQETVHGFTQDPISRRCTRGQPPCALGLPLSPGVGAILDRCVVVERHELLQGQDHDALWVAMNGGPLGRSGLELMITWRAKARTGSASAYTGSGPA
jgi:hypothetical protein